MSEPFADHRNRNAAFLSLGCPAMAGHIGGQFDLIPQPLPQLLEPPFRLSQRQTVLAVRRKTGRIVNNRKNIIRIIPVTRNDVFQLIRQTDPDKLLRLVTVILDKITLYILLL